MNSSVASSQQHKGEAVEFFKQLLRMVLPGFVMALVLIVLKLLGSAGATQAMHDLWTHAWKVHPLLWAMAGLVIPIAVLLQGADWSPDFDAWFALPVLEFLAHVFSLSVGALIPLAVVSEQPWGQSACQRYWGLALLLVCYVLISLVSTAGLLIVRGRAKTVHATQGAQSGTAPKATRMQLRAFSFFAVVFFVATVFAAQQRESTEQILIHAIVKVSVVLCPK